MKTFLFSMGIIQRVEEFYFALTRDREMLNLHVAIFQLSGKSLASLKMIP